jgi:hypothetical protein
MSTTVNAVDWLKIPQAAHTQGEDGHLTHYEIRDEKGMVVAVHGRRDIPNKGKRMWWEQPNGAPGLGERGLSDLPLYGTHELAQVPPEIPVVITEGEKARDALKKRGIVAVGTVTGAKTTHSPEAFRPVLNHPVILWPDNDDDGRHHMRLTANALYTIGHPDVRQIAWREAPPKGDAFDFFDRGGTLEQGQALVVQAAPLRKAVGQNPSRNAGSPNLVTLSDVQPKVVTWLWRGRIPRGKLTLLVGDPGLGKSLLFVDFGARVTRGEEFPDGGGQVPAADVVLLSAEDGLADTIRPRFDVAGGDATRMHLLQSVRDASGERPFTLATDLPILEQVLEQTRPALLGIDPASAYLGNRDSYKDSEVRSLLAPLAMLADRYGVAVVLVVHLGKNEQRRALYRALGSIAFVAASRAMLVVARSPDDPARRFVAPGKANLGGEASGLAYRVVGVCPVCQGDVQNGMECHTCHVQSVGKIIWEDEPVPGLDADRLLGVQAAPEERGEGRDADELLCDLLADGEVAAGEILKAAKANGISERTLYRSKRRLRVRARKTGQPGKKGAWFWSLPPEQRVEPETVMDAPKTATHGREAVFEQPVDQKVETPQTSSKTATRRSLAIFGDIPQRDGVTALPDEIIL